MDNIRTNGQLKVITLNTRGLRDSQKRKTVLNWLKNNKADVVLLQETYFTPKMKNILDREWGEHHYHSYTDSCHSRGVSILLSNNLKIDHVNVKTCSEGRKLLLNLSINNVYYTIVSLYTPNNIENRIQFLKQASQWIIKNSQHDSHVIVAGDMNCVYDINDRSSGKMDKSSKYFLQLQSDIKICDLWRTVNPQRKAYTYIPPGDKNVGSRIDYIMSTDALKKMISSVDIITAAVPDHKAVVATFKHSNTRRGKGYWKIDNSILNNKAYIVSIENIFHNTINEYHMCPKRDVWDLCKIRFKEYSIRHCTELNLKRKNEISEIEQKITNLDKILIHDRNNTNIKKTRDNLKSRFDTLTINKADGAQIRSSAKWVEQGERSTSYFLGLEKSRQVNNTINCLLSDSNAVCDTDQDILKQCTDFYNSLYTSRNPSDEKINKFYRKLGEISSLDDTAKIKCEGHISTLESEEAVEKLSINKSPGLDGLSAEFYKELWPVVGEYVTQVFNEGFENGCLSNTQQESVLTLLYKKGDSKRLKIIDRLVSQI